MNWYLFALIINLFLLTLRAAHDVGQARGWNACLQRYNAYLHSRPRDLGGKFVEKPKSPGKKRKRRP